MFVGYMGTSGADFNTDLCTQQGVADLLCRARTGPCKVADRIVWCVAEHQSEKTDQAILTLDNVATCIAEAPTHLARRFSPD